MRTSDCDELQVAQNVESIGPVGSSLVYSD